MNKVAEYFGTIRVKDIFSYANYFSEALETGHYDAKADVFSFGISFFTILTCHKPYGNMFDNISNQFMQMQKLQQSVSSGVRPGPVPEEPAGVGELMESCWHGDPQERPTMKQVIDKIRQIQDINGLV